MALVHRRLPLRSGQQLPLPMRLRPLPMTMVCPILLVEVCPTLLVEALPNRLVASKVSRHRSNLAGMVVGFPILQVEARPILLAVGTPTKVGLVSHHRRRRPNQVGKVV